MNNRNTITVDDLTATGSTEASNSPPKNAARIATSFIPEGYIPQLLFMPWYPPRIAESELAFASATGGMIAAEKLAPGSIPTDGIGVRPLVSREQR